MKLLIDGDILLHRFAFANQFSIDWDNTSEYVRVGHPDKAKYELDVFVEYLMESTKATSYVFCISSDFNFRYSILPTYKHNRINVEKPELYYLLLEHVHNNYSPFSWKYLEADDVMGLLSTREPKKCIIATLDKDLNQIPGLHFNWNSRAMSTVTKKDGDYWFLSKFS